MLHFENTIGKLPEADIHIDGAEVRVSQAQNHQIVFMEFKKDAIVPEHQHSDQVEFVVDGKVDVFIEGVKNTYRKGDQFHIKAGILHSAKVYSGYVAITFFDEPNRYAVQQGE